MIGQLCTSCGVSLVGSSVGRVLTRAVYLCTSRAVFRLCHDAGSHFRSVCLHNNQWQPTWWGDRAPPHSCQHC